MYRNIVIATLAAIIAVLGAIAFVSVQIGGGIFWSVIGLITLVIVSSRFKFDVTELISRWQYSRLTRFRAELAGRCIHASPLIIAGRVHYEITLVVIGTYHVKCSICGAVLPILYDEDVTQEIIRSTSPKDLRARMEEVSRLASKVSKLSGWDRSIGGKKDE